MKNYFDFTGKTVVITGGRRGLGKAMSIAFAAQGALVIVIARNTDDGGILRDIADAGGKGVYLSADLANPQDRAGLIDRAAKMGNGRVDILINNAGLQFSETAETCTPEQWNISESILLNAPFELAQQAIPYMKKQGGGKIINIASICAFREAGWNFSYGVMKSAVVGMTRCMANTLAQYKINVNAIAPGIVHTDLTEGCFSNPDVYENQKRKYPANRLGEPEEIAGPALFLASEMSSFIHGQTIVADGGFCGN